MWSPQEVPSDTAIACIDADGTYTVTLNRDDDTSPVLVAGLMVGPSTGHANLILSGNSLTLSAALGIDIRANGEVRLTAAPGAGVQLESAGAIDNDGTIYAERLCPTCGVTDRLSGNVANHGSVRVATTLTLGAMNGSFTNTSAGSVVIDGGGELVVPTGIGARSVTWHAGSLSGDGRLTAYSGDVVYNDGALGRTTSGSPVLQLVGANLTLGAPQTSVAVLAVQAQASSATTVTGNIGATTELQLNAAPATPHSTVTLLANPVNAGTLKLMAEAGDTLQLTGAGGLTNLGAIVAGDVATSVIQLSMSIANSGTTTVGGAVTFDAAGGTFANSGAIGGASGLVVSVEPTATFVTSGAGAVSAVGLNVHGGTLRGEGSIETLANTESGIVSPGSAVGALTIGQFVQDASSTLKLDVVGIATPADYDRLVISGSATLDGSLEVSTAASFSGGSCGDTFDVLTVAGSISGSFATVSGGISPTRAWRPAYVPNAVRLAGYDPTTPINLGGVPSDLGEGGTPVTYDVCLGSMPLATVTVTATADPQLSVSPPSLAFSGPSAALPQILTVQAIDDAVYEGLHSGSVQHSAVSTDPAFDGQTHQIAIAIEDNDNSPPSAVTDDAQGTEDQATVVAVLANDTDVEHDALAVSGVTQPAHGSTVVSGGGTTVTYTPSANYHGTDSFTYTVSDAAGGSATGTVNVTVASVNDAPNAVNDAMTASSGTPATFDVLSNDTDVDADPLSVTQVSAAAHGSVSIAAGAQGVVYTAAAHYGGPDTFTYTISDGAGGSATATVTVTVSVSNQNPIAGDDTGTTDEDTPISVPVLSNDNDPDGDPLTISEAYITIGGAVAVNGQNVVYTPTPNFNGTATFSYTISDGQGGQATAIGTITVRPVNDAPVAANDVAATNEDVQKVVSVLANDSDIDGDLISMTQVSLPAHGVAIITGGGTTITYTPSPNYNGADSFSYVVADGHGGQATATVTVSIAAVNDPPMVLGDTATTWKNWKIMVPVLANDTDVEGDSIVLATLGTPSKGTVSNFHDQVLYNPGASVGPASITYTARDSKGAVSSVATLNVTILPKPAATDMKLGTIVFSPYLGGPTGHAFTLTVTYSNGGSVTAPNIVVSMDQVTGLKFRSTFKGDRCATLTSGLTACERPSLAGNTSATFALLHFTATAKGTYTLNLHVDAPNSDPNTSNNNKTIVVSVP